MRNILHIAGLILMMISTVFCSDEFLSKNNRDNYLLYDTLYLYNYQENIDTIVQVPLSLNSDYTIFMQPKWLSFNSMHGKLSDGTIPLSFSIVQEYIPPVYQTQYGTIIVDVENVGLISFIVALSNLGSPLLLCSPSALNFESPISQTFTISNEAEGTLKWEITGIPDWLSLSQITGSLFNGNSITISASLNSACIPHGQDLLDTLQLISNSSTGNFAITVHVSEQAIIPSEVKQIGGIVTDAELSHESGILAICTKSPNSLIVLNTYTNESNTIALGRTPACVSLSEDGHRAAIGYTEPIVSYVDIDNLEIINDYSIDCVPYDVALGNNDWCYITPDEDQWVSLRNLNLNTGELISGNNSYMIYEKTIIKKIPGKPSLVGTRFMLAPSGILIFDITKGLASDTISYYHESLEKFWISLNGTKIYTAIKYVYYLPDYDTQYHPYAPPLYGQIQPEMNFIFALDECPAVNSIFLTSSDFIYESGYSSLIEQFNTTSLSKTGTFNLSTVYLIENEIRKSYETSAWYIFVNKEGSRLYALKNLKEKYNKDYWAIEIFQLGNTRISASSVQVNNAFKK